MEIIIFIAVVVAAALLWNGYVKAKKADSDQTIDNWQPPKAEDKPWPYGEKLPEGKIHVKVADVAPTAPTDSEDRVETPAPAPALLKFSLLLFLMPPAPAPLATPSPLEFSLNVAILNT